MAVTIGQAGIIWIGCFDDGLVRFDPIKKTFKQFELKENLLTEQERLRQNSVVDILEDVGDPNILWLAGNDGLYSFNKKTEKIDHFPSTAPNSENTAINALFMEKPGLVWLGTYSAGVVAFNTDDKSWEYFVSNQRAWSEKNTNYNIIYDLAKKSATELWIASLDSGSGILNTETGKFLFTLEGLGILLYPFQIFTNRSVKLNNSPCTFTK